MNDSEMMLSARQVQEKLDVSSQMSGIYYRELEKVTNTKIKTMGRTGRSFNSEQVQILLMARNIVQSDSKITVSEAMARAVGVSKMPLESVKPTDSPGVSLENLKTALREAQKDLIDEVVSLKEEVKGLRGDIALQKSSNPGLENNKIVREEKLSLIVRIAIRVDTWFKKFR
jgi:NACalpha-BTF3-like transcription factor